VVWHHVKGTAATPSFSYIIDPGPWLPAEKAITADFKGLKLTPPLYYIEITQKAVMKMKQ
jgi:hypothetical protein